VGPSSLSRTKRCVLPDPESSGACAMLSTCDDVTTLMGPRRITLDIRTRWGALLPCILRQVKQHRMIMMKNLTLPQLLHSPTSGQRLPLRSLNIRVLPQALGEGLRRSNDSDQEVGTRDEESRPGIKRAVVGAEEGAGGRRRRPRDSIVQFIHSSSVSRINAVSHGDGRGQRAALRQQWAGTAGSSESSRCGAKRMI
jgi:hypothetical protein